MHCQHWNIVQFKKPTWLVSSVVQNLDIETNLRGLWWNDKAQSVKANDIQRNKHGGHCETWRAANIITSTLT